jgi:hypothetical protein
MRAFVMQSKRLCACVVFPNLATTAWKDESNLKKTTLRASYAIKLRSDVTLVLHWQKEDLMRLSLKSMAIAGGVLWGSGVLLVGLLNLVRPSYGLSFLQMISSVYPGFHSSRTIGDVLVGTCYALLDGAIAALIFGWLYNLVVGQARQ